MTEFAYNNIKNASTGHILFGLNFGYYSRISFKKEFNLRLRSQSTDELARKLRKLMEVYYQNLLHAQELQKNVYDKGGKSQSYTPSKKVWPNSKYIKTKEKKRLENKFFRPFWVFYTVRKQIIKPITLKLY